VIEFPERFHHFRALMAELEIPLEPVTIGSGLFPARGSPLLSQRRIDQEFRGLAWGWQTLRFSGLQLRSLPRWWRWQHYRPEDLRDRCLADLLPANQGLQLWLKLLVSYAFSMPLRTVQQFPAALAVPVLRDYLFVDWLRVPGGVYSYMERILARFRGEVRLNCGSLQAQREADGVVLRQGDRPPQRFDRLVLATPPDQVLRILTDPSPQERMGFADWQANYATTVLHRDRQLYRRRHLRTAAEFDFFPADGDWGYNAALTRICALPPEVPYGITMRLEAQLNPALVIQRFHHHSPFYTVPALQQRQVIAAINGDRHTWFVGAYLEDGLHEGAIASADAVAARFR
jgi:predicted NAD/FAD-binding protein